MSYSEELESTGEYIWSFTIPECNEEESSPVRGGTLTALVRDAVALPNRGKIFVITLSLPG